MINIPIDVITIDKKPCYGEDDPPINCNAILFKIVSLEVDFKKGMQFQGKYSYRNQNCQIPVINITRYKQKHKINNYIKGQKTVLFPSAENDPELLLYKKDQQKIKRKSDKEHKFIGFLI